MAAGGHYSVVFLTVQLIVTYLVLKIHVRLSFEKNNGTVKLKTPQQPILLLQVTLYGAEIWHHGTTHEKSGFEFLGACTHPQQGRSVHCMYVYARRPPPFA